MICSCGKEMMDCFIERADEFRSETHWFFCNKCLVHEKIVLGPPKKSAFKSDLVASYKRAMGVRR